MGHPPFEERVGDTAPPPPRSDVHLVDDGGVPDERESLGEDEQVPVEAVPIFAAPGPAGIAGAGLIAAIALVMFETVTPAGAAVVLAAGVVGMTVDSLLGATLEGDWLENEGVNFAATVAGALCAATLAVALGIESLSLPL